MRDLFFLSPVEYNRWFSFDEYLEFMERLVEQEKTSGEDQSRTLVDFTKLNFHRIRRITRNCHLTPETRMLADHICADMTWIVIAEAWCGDVPQNLPYIHAMSLLNHHINLRILLKNENMNIMNRFLTNGSQSIPKLICTDPVSYEVIGTWGPRPAEAQNLVRNLKKIPGFSKEKLQGEIQKWYTKDKGKQIQAEFRKLFITWNEKLIKKPQEHLV